MTAFLFPGQGSQAVEMGKAMAEAFPVARQTFEEADAALGIGLSKLCFEGPDEALRRTEITQPAILTTSVAILRVLAELRPTLRPTVVAGHSLGEWSALVAVGALPFAAAVRGVHERGRMMQAAVPQNLGAMCAVLGLTPERVTKICAEIESGGWGGTGIVRPANFNSNDQTVISGHAEAVARAGKALLAEGAKRIMPLQVSAPFHCPLMEPAAYGLRAVLETLPIGSMNAPVISNVEATAYQDASRVRALLVAQVTAPVRWVESIQTLVGRAESQALEIGPGKVLGGLAKRIDRNLKVYPTEDPTALEKALESLNG